jgi:pyruvate dehydrogenase E1 component alpha subunit
MRERNTVIRMQMTSSLENPGLTDNQLIEIYRWLVLIREVEEMFLRLLTRDKTLTGMIQSGIGREAISVGASLCLRKDDYVMPYQRGRGVLLMKDVPLKEIVAGAYGKSKGTGRGRWQHNIAGDRQTGVIMNSGIAGIGIPVAVGVALGIRLRKTDRVVACFFGDEAISAGHFYEGLHMAGDLGLPVVFICEGSSHAGLAAMTSVSDGVAGYGFPVKTVDGNDVLAIYKATREAVDRARKGEGPALIECVLHQPQRDLLHDGEKQVSWRRNCPVRRFRDYLVDSRILSDESSEEIYKETLKQIEEAVSWAEESPYPLPEEALDDVRVVYAG